MGEEDRPDVRRRLFASPDRSCPDKIPTVLTDTGVRLTFPPRDAGGPTTRDMTPMFDIRCFDIRWRENGSAHRRAKIKHPWTNGQVARLNRTRKEATVKRSHYNRHAERESHRANFIRAANFARRRKTLNGRTPSASIGKLWTKQPQRFKGDPSHQTPGRNTLAENPWQCR
jgi:hypothetical protein